MDSDIKLAPFQGYIAPPLHFGSMEIKVRQIHNQDEVKVKTPIRIEVSCHDRFGAMCLYEFKRIGYKMKATKWFDSEEVPF